MANTQVDVLRLYEAANGVRFNMRVIRDGDNYGREDCLTHEGKPMIEFYDERYPHTEFGQFVSRYYVKTLATIPPNTGLNLDDGIPDWTIDGATLNTMMRDALLFI